MKGLVRIRLARFGRKNHPLYNIVVTQRYKARDSKPIEVLGTYDPIPQRPQNSGKADVMPWKNINLDFSRTKYWIGCGAQPSDTIVRILDKAGILNESWDKYKDKRVNKEIIIPRREVYE